MASFALRKLPYAMKHSQQLSSAWRGASAGGCINYDTVIDNPRFLLILEQPTDLQLELCGPAQHSVGADLEVVPTDASAGPGKPLASSGNFRRGFCLLEARAVPPGSYIVTAATFEPKQEGAFTLTCGSSQPVKAGPLKPEGHGLQRDVYRGEWSTTAGTAVGSPNQGAFHRNPQVKLTISRRTEVVLRLRAGGPSGVRLSPSRPSLGLVVYQRSQPLGPEDARGPKPFISANGGVYSYPPGGVAVPKTTLDAGDYVLVLSTFDPHNSPFELVLYASQGAARLEGLVG